MTWIFFFFQDSRDFRYFIPRHHQHSQNVPEIPNFQDPEYIHQTSFYSQTQHKIPLPDCACRFGIRKIASFVRNLTAPAVVRKDENRGTGAAVRIPTLLTGPEQCQVQGKLFALSSLLREDIAMVSPVFQSFYILKSADFHNLGQFIYVQGLSFSH